MRKEIERKAKVAADAAVALAGKQHGVTVEKRAKLKALWEAADAVWRRSGAAEGTTYQDSLADLSNPELRKISKYVFRQLYNTDDAQSLMIKRGMKAPEITVRVLAFVRTNMLVQEAALRPIRNGETGCWMLPPWVDV